MDLFFVGLNYSSHNSFDTFKKFSSLLSNIFLSVEPITLTKTTGNQRETKRKIWKNRSIYLLNKIFDEISEVIISGYSCTCFGSKHFLKYLNQFHLMIWIFWFCYQNLLFFIIYERKKRKKTVYIDIILTYGQSIEREFNHSIEHNNFSAVDTKNILGGPICL